MGIEDVDADSTENLKRNISSRIRLRSASPKKIWILVFTMFDAAKLMDWSVSG
jgi:hypothetical protein